MAVKIRLNRMGAKKSPFYRIVVADSRAPRDGRFIEVVGNYDSTKEPAVVNIDVRRHWSGCPRVHSLLIQFVLCSPSRASWLSLMQLSMLKTKKEA